MSLKLEGNYEPQVINDFGHKYLNIPASAHPALKEDFGVSYMWEESGLMVYAYHDAPFDDRDDLNGGDPFPYYFKWLVEDWIALEADPWTDQPEANESVVLQMESEVGEPEYLGDR